MFCDNDFQTVFNAEASLCNRLLPAGENFLPVAQGISRGHLSERVGPITAPCDGFRSTSHRDAAVFLPPGATFRTAASAERATILFMGRVRPIKGYDVFIRALGELPNVRGIMVGDVDNTSAKAIDRLATDSGCASRLEVRPWASRHEIPSLLQSTTLFVFPSICPETLGIVGLEAMAFGVPVVASDVGGVRQWLRHGENGLLVPPKDHHALAAAIESLINAPETLMRMGKAGLDTVRNGFLVQQHVERLTSLYYQVACGNPLPVSAHGSTS